MPTFWEKSAEVERAESKRIERFQAALLAVLSAMLPAGEYALKGGGNLRFFLGSARRSRDLDFDFLGRNFSTFAAHVDRALASGTLARAVGATGLAAANPHRSKDTETTKRWNIELSGADSTGGARLKIEISGREPVASADPMMGTARSEFGAMLPGRLPRMLHYQPPQAIEQKVNALAMRRETEPRDVFDLGFLFQGFPRALDRATLDPNLTRRAITSALDISYGAYEKLVLRYLDDDALPLHLGEDAWHDLVLLVVQSLERRLTAGDDSAPTAEG